MHAPDTIVLCASSFGTEGVGPGQPRNLPRVSPPAVSDDTPVEHGVPTRFDSPLDRSHHDSGPERTVHPACSRTRGLTDFVVLVLQRAEDCASVVFIRA